MDFILNQDFRDNIREHFVCITGTYIHVDGAGKQVGDEKKFAFSAFVIEIYGVWCLVTAGHVIQLMDKVCKRSDTKLLRCSLADYFNLNAKVKEPTPFPFADLHHIDIDQDGVDVGLIPLPNLFRDSIKSNGIVPLPVGAWKGGEPPRCDEYALLGIPEHDILPIAPTATRGAGLRAKLSLVGLEPQPVPEDKVLSPIPRFCAKLLDGGELKSVKGMSGGPIVGIRKNDQGIGEYACIAVQGSWDSATRQVFGTPMAFIVGAIKAELDGNITKLIPLTKLDAVRRQLETGVDLFFLQADPVAIHTLVNSALKIIKSVGERGAQKPMFVDAQPIGMPDQPTAAEINAYQTFFDNADSDTNAVLDFHPVMMEALLSAACRIYMELTGERIKSFFCMIAWFKCRGGRTAFKIPDNMVTFLDDLYAAFQVGDRQAFFVRFMEAKRESESPSPDENGADSIG